MIKKGIANFLLKLKLGSFKEQYKHIASLSRAEDVNGYVSHFKKLLSHSYYNVPFYSKRLEKANFVRDNVVRFNEFERLPLLTRSDIISHLNILTSRDIDNRRWRYNNTSGSTGTPMRFIQDASDIKWGLASQKYYYENLVGIDELAAKKVVLMAEGDEVTYTTRLSKKLISLFWNMKFLNTFRITEDDLGRYVTFINSYKPNIVKSMPTTLYELCKFIERKRMTIYQPAVVISSFQKLHRYMREKIESVFGTKVYEFYGSREISSIAGECNAGLLHLLTFNNYVEVLDTQNRPVREGEMGKLIVTDLHNYAMPFIRYEIGDMAILGPKRCKCGNPLPTLKDVTGKSRDFFIREDGSLLNGGFFMYLFRTRDWIKAFRVIQEDYRKIRVKAVLKDHINDSERREIDQRIKRAMGNTCKVIWELVDEIPRSQGGKYLYIKSLLYDR